MKKRKPVSGVGELVKQLRKMRGISQHKLSRLSGVHRCTIAMIEIGRQDPQTRTIFAIARALGISPADIMMV